ncbi:MAG: hypothetical protein PHG66_01455 [Candidatus Colwellbacteria bacterium]|nr:hypothetical protein [Candidatus Colwellbacteria bacterium]
MEKESSTETDKGRIISSGVVVLLVIACGIVALLLSGNKPPSISMLSDDGTSGESSPLTESAIPDVGKDYLPSGLLGDKISLIGLSPEESYLVAKKELSKMSGFGDLKVFGERYGTVENLRNIESMESAGKIIDLDIIAGELADKMSYSEDVSVSGKKESLDKVEIGLKNLATGEEGVAIMILEGGEWRFSSESWNISSIVRK